MTGPQDAQIGEQLPLDAFKTQNDRITQRWWSRCSHFMPETLDSTTNILYHYTGISAVKSIIESNSLRLSNISYLNDALEIVHGQMVLDKIIKSEKYLDEGILHKEAFDFILKTRALLFQIPMYNTYISCFCEDGDLLSQWRGYGQGVAIGFDRWAIREVFTGAPRLVKVIYNEYYGLEIFKGLIESFTAGLLAELGNENYEKFKRHLVDLYQIYVEAVFPSLKHASFQEEKEWRLLYHRPSYFRPADEPPINFAEKRDLLVPTVALPTVSAKILPIKEVVIGPSPRAQLLKNGIEELLAKHGHEKIPIRHSNIPFRP